jgi:hypothetical protein
MKKPIIIKILILLLILLLVSLTILSVLMIKNPEEKCESVGGEWVDLWDCCCPKKCFEIGEAMVEDFEACQCCLVERKQE